MTIANREPDPKTRRSEPDLDRRYGRIAISAVVAALPYRADIRDRDETETEADARDDRRA